MFRFEVGAAAVVSGVDNDAAGMVCRIESLWGGAGLRDASLLLTAAKRDVDEGFHDGAFGAVGIDQLRTAGAADRDFAAYRCFLELEKKNVFVDIFIIICQPVSVRPSILRPHVC